MSQSVQIMDNEILSKNERVSFDNRQTMQDASNQIVSSGDVRTESIDGDVKLGLSDREKVLQE